MIEIKTSGWQTNIKPIPGDNSLLISEIKKKLVLLPIFLSLQVEDSSSVLGILIQYLAHQRIKTKPYNTIMEVTPWYGQREI